MNPVEVLTERMDSSKPNQNRPHKGDFLVDREKYVDIRQISQILERSTQRVRKIIKKGEIPHIRREGKIFCLKQDVLDYKKKRDANSSSSRTKRLKRAYNRIIRATRVVSELISYDTKLSKEEKSKFLRILQNYQKTARDSLKKLES